MHTLQVADIVPCCHASMYQHASMTHVIAHMVSSCVACASLPCCVTVALTSAAQPEMRCKGHRHRRRASLEGVHPATPSPLLPKSALVQIKMARPGHLED